MCCLKNFCWTYSLQTGAIAAAVLTAFQGVVPVTLAIYISLLDKKNEDLIQTNFHNITYDPISSDEKVITIIWSYFVYVWGTLITFPIMVANIVCLISLCVGIIRNSYIGIVLWLSIESLLLVLFIATSVFAMFLDLFPVAVLYFHILLMIYMWFVVLSYLYEIRDAPSNSKINLYTH